MSANTNSDCERLMEELPGVLSKMIMYSLEANDTGVFLQVCCVTYIHCIYTASVENETLWIFNKILCSNYITGFSPDFLFL